MGVVALFGDMTYEGARGIAGPYLGLLGAGAATVGFVAGLGEFLGYALRLATGRLADRTRAYWTLVVAGYAVNLVAVPGLALAGSWRAAAALILLERVGKAVRSPARSTLVSFAGSEAGAGWSFGLEEALDQVGAVLGPLLTALAMWIARDEPAPERYRLAFALLLLPVVANLALVLLARRTYPHPESFEREAPRGRERPGGLFRWYIAASMLLALGFADWALVAYHAARTGLVGPSAVPLLYAGVMGVDALAALAFGRRFDRSGIRVLAAAAALSAGFAPLAFLAPSPEVLIAGAALWAAGMGAQDSVFKAAVATLVPKEERARAYGLFFALFGLAWWLGSTAMGLLYERSIPALVAFSSLTQLAAVPLYLRIAARADAARRG
jgi:MFS family permease